MDASWTLAFCAMAPRRSVIMFGHTYRMPSSVLVEWHCGGRRNLCDSMRWINVSFLFFFLNTYCYMWYDDNRDATGMQSFWWPYGKMIQVLNLNSLLRSNNKMCVQSLLRWFILTFGAFPHYTLTITDLFSLLSCCRNSIQFIKLS